MADQQPDPPLTLQEAEERFSRFLASNGYPARIRWITADQIVVDDGFHHFIWEDGAEKALAEGPRRYNAGLKAGLGIMLHTICATQTETVASIYCPTDETDAQYRMIGLGLKLSCTGDRRPASTIADPAEWKRLRWENRERSVRVREAFDLYL
jgi:hypothetical protein